jgi:hypothetical protein
VSKPLRRLSLGLVEHGLKGAFAEATVHFRGDRVVVTSVE